MNSSSITDRNGSALLLERSANDVEYRLIALGKRHMLGTADGKVAYLREAAALLAELQSPIERDVYAGKLSAELGVNKSAILDQVQELMERRKKQQKSRQLSQIVRNTENTIKKVNPDAAAHPRAVSAEEGLLGLLLLNPDYIGQDRRAVCRPRCSPRISTAGCISG